MDEGTVSSAKPVFAEKLQSSGIPAVCIVCGWAFAVPRQGELKLYAANASQERGAVHFTDEQMEWLRLIKNHIVASLSI